MMNRKEKFKGLILAAGYGKRLRPLSDIMPKPLIPICGRPVIDIVFEKMISAGINNFAINTHHLSAILEAYIKKSIYADRSRIFHEEKILGTGGVLAGCRSFLETCENIVLHNGDIISNVSIETLIQNHIKNKAIATMVLVDGPENRVHSKNGIVVDMLAKLNSPITEYSKILTYAGICAISSKIVEFLPQASYFTLVDLFLDIIKCNPNAIHAYIPDNLYWNDIGTFKQYFSVHEDILVRKKISLPGIKPYKNIFTGNLTKIPRSSQINGFLSAGANSIIGVNSKFKNCIILDNVKIARDTYQAEELITPYFTVHRDIELLENIKILKDCEVRKCKISTLAEQGSARKFYRISDGAETKILMISSADDPDFGRFIRIGNYLYEHNLGTPQIFKHNEDEHSVLVEDLGDKLLNPLAKKTKSILSLYSKVVDWLVHFQVKTIMLDKECQNVIDREFDFEGLRWETEYFTDNFLLNFTNFRKKNAGKIFKAFDWLAKTALKQPQFLLHRDFQSQNILIKGKDVRIVDFQGMRYGPFTYDIMSLIYDPYVRISQKNKDLLLKRYFDGLRNAIPEKMAFSNHELISFALVSGLQRLMQALGAYGFLALKKGKIDYLNYIPTAKKNLLSLIYKSKKITNFEPDILEILPFLENTRISPVAYTSRTT